jgi:proline iminopeptidase
VFFFFVEGGGGPPLPDAGDPATSLRTNTTQHLIADIEALREHVGVERWLVLGGSWGSTLGLAYAERHPERVTEMVLFSIATTTRAEVEWITRGCGVHFPEAWARFRDGVPPEDRDGSLVDAYSRLLEDPDPDVRARSAQDWCAWEQAHVSTPDPRYDDPAFRARFARLVTHYWRHAGFLEDGELLRDANRLAEIPGVLIHGRLDVSSPLHVPERLAAAWPGAKLTIIDDEGHTGGPTRSGLVRAATARFAA